MYVRMLQDNFGDYCLIKLILTLAMVFLHCYQRLTFWLKLLLEWEELIFEDMVSILFYKISFLIELTEIELWQDYGQTCRVFTLNDNIISIIDVPELPGQIGPPRVNIIIRSMFGKFVWTGQMNLFGNQELPSAVIGTNPTKIDLIPPAKYGHTPVFNFFIFSITLSSHLVIFPF